MFYEPLCKKTGLRGFRPGSTQIGLYSHRSRLEACFGYKLKRNGTLSLSPQFINYISSSKANTLLFFVEKM